MHENNNFKPIYFQNRESIFIYKSIDVNCLRVKALNVLKEIESSCQFVTIRK